LLTTTETSRALGVSIAFLANQRIRPQPEEQRIVPYVRLGSRTIRYRVGDLKEYLRVCTTS
jgi:hypothetical protein